MSDIRCTTPDQPVPCHPVASAADLLSVHAPQAGVALGAAQSLAATVTDPRRLELARLRIAMLLGNDRALAERSPAALEAGLSEETVDALARWPSSDLFDETDRACLGLAEQFVIDVSGVTDRDVQPVLERLGPEGLYGFVQALWVWDMTQRLELALAGATGPGGNGT